MKKPYEGLQPGTEDWMGCWRKYPELQNEMLEYKHRLEGEKNDMEHKKAFMVIELEQQVEQAVEEVERILEEENFQEIVAPEPKKKTTKKEPKKTAEQPKPAPSDHIVTVKELADELGTQPKALRKWLRKNNAPRFSGRWEWKADSPRLEEIRTKYRMEHGEHEE